MPKKAEFLKFNSIKSYINDVKKMRSSTGAVKRLIQDFDSTIEAVIAEAGKLAKEVKRNTIMEQDVIPTLEKHLGKRHLNWQETAEEIIQQNPTDLGKISKAINKEKGTDLFSCNKEQQLIENGLKSQSQKMNSIILKKASKGLSR